jgi:hypothetical protein
VIALTLLAALALAAEQPHTARDGEKVESIAESWGVPDAADAIREASGLAPGAQPTPGDLLRVPLPEEAVHAHGGAVLSLSGTGTATDPSGASTPLEVALPLAEGTTVCTDADSYATVRLAVAYEGYYHDDITLLSSTCVVVEAARATPERRSSLVSLRQGSLSVRATGANPGRVTVRTDAGITTGDGGGFRVTLEEDEAARTEALYSEVAVIGAGEEVAVPAGYGSRVRGGEVPSPPVKLLDPGTPTTPGDGAPLRRPDFRWRPVDGAFGYRVEFSVTEDFSELVMVEYIDSHEWFPEALFFPFRVPGLWWRVASFDRTGFLGIPSDPHALEFPAGVGP